MIQFQMTGHLAADINDDGRVNHFDGDFNGDGVANLTDFELLHAQLSEQSPNVIFDLSRDGQVTQADVTYLIENIFGTTLGNFDLDGDIDADDIDMLFVEKAAGTHDPWYDLTDDGYVN